MVAPLLVAEGSAVGDVSKTLWLHGSQIMPVAIVAQVVPVGEPKFT